MQIRPSSNLAEQLADYLGQQIVDGTLAADEPIAESRLAAELQVNRGSVRSHADPRTPPSGAVIPRRGAVVSDAQAGNGCAVRMRAILAQAS